MRSYTTARLAVDGTYVAFSTAPEHVAFDGTAGHSPFGKAIVNPMDLKI
ncbi:MAG: caspase family protein [Myxococcota bacterium]|nr:caspase family protein [Myxococcota bacterium]